MSNIFKKALKTQTVLIILIVIKSSLLLRLSALYALSAKLGNFIIKLTRKLIFLNKLVCLNTHYIAVNKFFNYNAILNQKHFKN